MTVGIDAGETFRHFLYTTPETSLPGLTGQSSIHWNVVLGHLRCQILKARWLLGPPVKPGDDATGNHPNAFFSPSGNGTRKPLRTMEIAV